MPAIRNVKINYYSRLLVKINHETPRCSALCVQSFCVVYTVCSVSVFNIQIGGPLLSQAFEHALQSLRDRDNDDSSTLTGTRSAWLPGAGELSIRWPGTEPVFIQTEFVLYLLYYCGTCIVLCLCAYSLSLICMLHMHVNITRARTHTRSANNSLYVE